MRWRAVDDVLGIGTDEAVGDVARDSIVDGDKFKRVLAEDGVDLGSKTLGMRTSTCPASSTWPAPSGLSAAGQRQRSWSTISATSGRALLGEAKAIR